MLMHSQQPANGNPLITVDFEQVVNRTVAASFGIIVTLILYDVFLSYLQWLPSEPARLLSNITREDGLANWYSSLLTLLAGE